MHHWPRFLQDDGFRSPGPVAQCTLGSFCVVVFSPAFDDDLRLPHRIEYLAIEQFIPHPGVEALNAPVLPGASGFDESGFASTPSIQVRRLLATKSGPLPLRTNAGVPRRMNRSVRASITSVELSFRFNRIAKHSRLNSSKLFSVRSAFPSSVRQCTNIRPNMVAILRPQSDACSIVPPKPAFLLLFRRHFQSLPSPPPLDQAVTGLPTRISQQHGNASVAVAAVLPSQLGHVGNQPFIRHCARTNGASMAHSSWPLGRCRCVQRCCPSTRQIRRSDT